MSKKEAAGHTHLRSKQRVRDQGEVFTQEREVNAMLDLVKNEIDSQCTKSYVINRIKKHDIPQITAP